MKIENIEIDIIDIDLTRPYTIAYKTTSSIKTLLVKIILSDGTIGIGASNVSKYVVGLDTTDSYNNSKEYIDHLKGKDIDSFWMIINDIENKFIGDPGSKAGFNLAVYDAYCKKNGLRAKSMRDLEVLDVAPIYKTEYWDRVKGDALHPALALCIFDFGVNAGTGRAAKMIQKIVGTAVDGGIGPNSLKKIESYTDKHGIEDVVKTYQSERQKYYEKLKHFKTFGRGWTRRVNETTEAALKLI